VSQTGLDEIDVIFIIGKILIAIIQVMIIDELSIIFDEFDLFVD